MAIHQVLKNLQGLKKKYLKLRSTFNTHGEKISKTNMSNDLKLRKAFDLYSEVINVNYIHAGEAVGYKATYIPDKDTFIATVSIGHA